MLSRRLCAAKVSSQVPCCHYDEKMNSYVSLSRTAEQNHNLATRSSIRIRIFYCKIALRNI